VKRDRDIEIELLQKEKCQLDVYVTNLTQERSNLESTLEIKQNEISKLEAELSALQRKSQELKEQYGELADSYVHKISDFTNKHEEEIKHLKNDFLKEKEELLMQNEVYKECASNMETKANKIEEINCSLAEELKNLQNIHTDVRNLCKYAILLLCIIYLYIYLYTNTFLCKCTSKTLKQNDNNQKISNRTTFAK